MKFKNLSLSIVTTLALAAALIALPTSHATETRKVSDDSKLETSTSHNPFTHTTTEKVEGKAKRKHKTSHGMAEGEDHLKIERKTKDDGSKSSVDREESHSDQIDNNRK